MGSKDGEELLDDCKINVPPKPKKVNVTLNFRKEIITLHHNL